MRRLAAASLVLLLVAAAACGSGDGGEDGEGDGGDGALSFEEAELLSSTLFRNNEEGGATVTITAPLGEDAVLSASGEVDFAASEGHLVGEVTDATGSSPFEAYFVPDQLVLDAASVVGAGGGPYPEGTQWVGRPPQPSLPLDTAIGLVTALAAEQRDNPALVQQDPDVRVLRQDEIDGVPVTVFEYGPTTRYWVDADGLMRRAELTVAGLDEQVVIDVADHGPQTITPPPADQITPA